MKKTLLLSIILLLVSFGYAQKDSLEQKQMRRIAEMEQSVQQLRTDNDNLRLDYSILVSKLNSLQCIVLKDSATIKVITDTLNCRIQSANSGVESNQKTVKQRSVIGGVLAVVLLICAVIVYCKLHKKITGSNNTLVQVQQSQKKFQEESVKLDDEIIKLLDKQTQSLNSNLVKKVESDHSLALKVADEITYIEMNLSRMDKNIRGYKQLQKSVSRIKENFSANGYEMVEMLNLPYHEEMKAMVTFVPDNKLKEGEQIITKIIKPQVNYNGELIQTAQIEVSQNE